MPWDGPSFKSKHNHKLSDEAASHAAKVATRVLERTGNEGLAVRIGNHAGNTYHARKAARAAKAV